MRGLCNYRGKRSAQIVMVVVVLDGLADHQDCVWEFAGPPRLERLACDS